MHISVAEGPRGTQWRYSNSNNCIATQLGLLRQEERLRLEQWQGNWQLMTVCRLSTAMDSAPGLHYEICNDAHVITKVYTQESVSLVPIQNILGEKIHLQGLDADKGCLLCLSSTERWVHSGWRKWRWTCFKFSGSDSESYNSFGLVVFKGQQKKSRWYLFLQKEWCSGLDETSCIYTSKVIKQNSN